MNMSEVCEDELNVYTTGQAFLPLKLVGDVASSLAGLAGNFFSLSFGLL